MLAAWLEKDYVRTWFEDAGDWLREIDGRNDTFAWIRHFIAMDGAVPLGFCQMYDCHDAGESWYEVSGRGDTYSIDYLIGREEYLGKGYGKAIVRCLTGILESEGNARRIIVQPERENGASVHVLLANGYGYDEKAGYYVRWLR